jgi:ketosteroid isomerase-like protein
MSQENVEIVRKLYAGLGKGDMWGAAPLFDPTIELHRYGGQPGSWRGLDGLATGAKDYMEAFHDLRIEGERFVDLGDEKVLVFRSDHGRGRDSGLPFAQELADVLTLREGRIVKWESYWDRADALEAVGLRE